MPRTQSRHIRQFHQHLGPIHRLECGAADTVSAHHSLGQDVQAQVHRILAQRLADLGSAEAVEQQVRRAHSYRKALSGKSRQTGLHPLTVEAVNAYGSCLQAWAEGAKLSAFRHDLLPVRVNGRKIQPEDLAALLQEDEVGCQTGAYRGGDGSVILWHTEEDYEKEPGQRFDRLRLFTFKGAEGGLSTGFIYPDLLPGPTFGWQEHDYAQAIDTLHVRRLEMRDAILPNTLAWLSLYIGGRVPRADLARQLGPFQGGYSLTSVQMERGNIRVEKVEFANQQVHHSHLGESAGEHFFQTNVIRDKDLPIFAEEKTSTESRSYCEGRMTRAGRLVRKVHLSAQPRDAVLHMLSSQAGGEAAYANRDVKAYMVHHMGVEKTSIAVGAGARLRGDEVVEFHIHHD